MARRFPGYCICTNQWPDKWRIKLTADAQPILSTCMNLGVCSTLAPSALRRLGTWGIFTTPVIVPHPINPFHLGLRVTTAAS